MQFAILEIAGTSGFVNSSGPGQSAITGNNTLIDTHDQPNRLTPVWGALISKTLSYFGPSVRR